MSTAALAGRLSRTVVVAGTGRGRRSGARQGARFVSSSASKASSSSRASSSRAPPPPPFSTVDACPAPTCACAPMPALPEGLAIDQQGSLRGQIAAYDEHVLVCTGEPDWPSRIEDAHSGDNLAADLRELFGRGGKYSDPFHRVAVLNASFPSSVSQKALHLQTTSVYLLPSFRYVPFLPRVSFDSVDALAKGYLLPEHLHPAHDGRLSPIHRDRLTRHPAYQGLLYGVQDRIADALVLICGHGGRDARCGILGPVLQAEFERQLERAGVQVQFGPVQVPEEEEEENPNLKQLQGPESTIATSAPATTARVGLISHIGGHKFAGNVIIYVPPDWHASGELGQEKHPLAGYGIWYGRVEPKHVEGLVHETLVHGRVVTDHFRGAINQNREIIRL